MKFKIDQKIVFIKSGVKGKIIGYSNDTLWGSTVYLVDTLMHSRRPYAFSNDMIPDTKFFRKLHGIEK